MFTAMNPIDLVDFIRQYNDGKLRKEKILRDSPPRISIIVYLIGPQKSNFIEYTLALDQKTGGITEKKVKHLYEKLNIPSITREDKNEWENYLQNTSIIKTN